MEINTSTRSLVLTGASVCCVHSHGSGMWHCGTWQTIIKFSKN
jgi:hypothetical protein